MIEKIEEVIRFYRLEVSRLKELNKKEHIPNKDRSWVIKEYITNIKQLESK